MRLDSLLLLTACAALTACGPATPEPIDEPPVSQEDPCAPYGHIHREATGDWCHCDRGYLAATERLACVVDPNYVPRTEFDFGDKGEHACWHVTNGPYATVMASTTAQPRVDAFHTFYTVKLRPEGGQYVGTFQFKAYATGNFVAYLSHEGVPFSFHEGTKLVEPAATEPIPPELRDGACQGELVRMVGYELTDKVQYTVTVGPTEHSELSLVIEHL